MTVGLQHLLTFRIHCPLSYLIVIGILSYCDVTWAVEDSYKELSPLELTFINQGAGQKTITLASDKDDIIITTDEGLIYTLSLQKMGNLFRSGAKTGEQLWGQSFELRILLPKKSTRDESADKDRLDSSSLTLIQYLDGTYQLRDVRNATILDQKAELVTLLIGPMEQPSRHFAFRFNEWVQRLPLAKYLVQRALIRVLPRISTSNFFVLTFAVPANLSGCESLFEEAARTFKKTRRKSRNL